MYQLLKQEGAARRGVFTTVHGTVQTPAFQNVATCGAIKGALSALDLKEIGAQVMLCNTYHLHVRPGDKLVRKMGGLHKFTRWDGPILTDSGGFQVFSLAGLRRRSSPTSARPSPWRSMNAWKTRRPTVMRRNPARAPTAGWFAARRR